MAATALLSTASAINASLYATTEIGYTMAKEGNLPKIYSYNVFNSFEGLIISTLLIIPMILFFNLSEITTVATLIVLIVQGVVHIGHLLKINETKANKLLLVSAIVSIFGIVILTLRYTYLHHPQIGYYLLGAFGIAYLLELLLRLFTKRVICKQTIEI